MVEVDHFDSKVNIFKTGTEVDLSELDEVLTQAENIKTDTPIFVIITWTALGTTILIIISIIIVYIKCNLKTNQPQNENIELRTLNRRREISLPIYPTSEAPNYTPPSPPKQPLQSTSTNLTTPKNPPTTPKMFMLSNFSELNSINNTIE